VIGRLIAAAAAVLAIASPPAPRTQAPQDGQAGQASQTYRGGTDLVAVYATVTDESGRLVYDLQKSDFTVTDNGKVQPVVFFSNDVQPITIVVMLDRSGSMASNFTLVQEATDELISRLLPDDKARIGSLSHQIQILPGTFTNDHDELKRIVRYDMQQIGPSPVWTAVDRSITALLPEGGRRVVLLFSDGHDSPERGQVHTDVKDIMWRTKVDEIMVYAIGFASEAPQLSAPYLVRPRPGFPPTMSRTLSVHMQPPDPALKDLAAQSGGGYFELDERLDLRATFARVADELHHQYLLGFAPKKLDDKEHKLQVKVSRPDLTVRARRSYVARPPGK
jgi:Ca-activated chloride channel family protein